VRHIFINGCKAFFGSEVKGKRVTACPSSAVNLLILLSVLRGRGDFLTVSIISA